MSRRCLLEALVIAAGITLLAQAVDIALLANNSKLSPAYKALMEP